MHLRTSDLAGISEGLGKTHKEINRLLLMVINHGELDEKLRAQKMALETLQMGLNSIENHELKGLQDAVDT